jgi:hypothetical protein
MHFHRTQASMPQAVSFFLGAEAVYLIQPDRYVVGMVHGHEGATNALQRYFDQRAIRPVRN